MCKYVVYPISDALGHFSILIAVFGLVHVESSLDRGQFEEWQQYHQQHAHEANLPTDQLHVSRSTDRSSEPCLSPALATRPIDHGGKIERKVNQSVTESKVKKTIKK